MKKKDLFKDAINAEFDLVDEEAIKKESDDEHSNWGISRDTRIIKKSKDGFWMNGNKKVSLSSDKEMRHSYVL